MSEIKSFFFILTDCRIQPQHCGQGPPPHEGLGDPQPGPEDSSHRRSHGHL
jgi:hypothetical protein